MNAPKKILVTGGAGFIGCHLTRYLLEHTEAKLVLVDNLWRGKMDDDFTAVVANPRVNFITLDLTQPASYTQLGLGFDHVYHLAAVNGTNLFYEIPHEVLRINCLSLIYMLEWFQKNNREGKFCFTSSNEAYAGALAAFGQLPIPTPEAVPLVIEDTYNPRWSYAGTKLIGELFVINYAAHYNFRACIVRPHNFYGPRAGYSHVIPEWCLRIADRVEPFPLASPEQTRTFCYIEDAVRAMSMLMDSAATDGQPIETVHIGSRDEITIGDLAEKLFAVAGWRPQTLITKEAPKGSVDRRLADISKIKKLVGWEPQVSLEEGLQRTFTWYREHQKT